MRTILCMLVLVFATSLAVSATASPLIGTRTGGMVASKSALAILVPPPEEKSEEGGSEARETIFKTINFLILAGALGYLLRKPILEFLFQRSSYIRERLEEGRKALEESQARMAAIEEKLKHLEEEIAAFKESAAREAEAERQNLHIAAAEEASKILDSARARMDTASRAARLELRYFIAEEALKQAEQMIRSRLDEPTGKQLVSQFLTRLDVKQSRN